MSGEVQGGERKRTTDEVVEMNWTMSKLEVLPFSRTSSRETCLLFERHPA
jgi:hypothetical protein